MLSDNFLLLIFSGGTIAGLSLGSWLGALKAKVCILIYILTLTFLHKQIDLYDVLMEI